MPPSPPEQRYSEDDVEAVARWFAKRDLRSGLAWVHYQDEARAVLESLPDDRAEHPTYRLNEDGSVDKVRCENCSEAEATLSRYRTALERIANFNTGADGPEGLARAALSPDTEPSTGERD